MVLFGYSIHSPYKPKDKNQCNLQQQRFKKLSVSKILHQNNFSYKNRNARKIRKLKKLMKTQPWNTYDYLLKVLRFQYQLHMPLVFSLEFIK